MVEKFVPTSVFTKELPDQTVDEINEAGKGVEEEEAMKTIINAWKTITGCPTKNNSFESGGYLTADLLSGKNGKVRIELYKVEDSYKLVLCDFDEFRGEDGYDEAITTISNVYRDLNLAGVNVVEIDVPPEIFSDGEEIRNDILSQLTVPRESQEDQREAA